jgi:hypothetical protein
VLDTSTSPDPASDMTRAPMCTANPLTFAPVVSTSPVRRYVRTEHGEVIEAVQFKSPGYRPASETQKKSIALFSEMGFTKQNY